MVELRAMRFAATVALALCARAPGATPFAPSPRGGGAGPGGRGRPSQATSMSATKAPEEVAAVSASDTFVLEEEMVRGQRDLFLSTFIYGFADIREACRLGLSKIPFALVALEDDAMTTSQILNGAPHVREPFAEGSTAGFSLQDLAFCMLRITSKFGLGDGESYLLGEGGATAASQGGSQEREKKSSDFIKNQELVLRRIDLAIKAILPKDAGTPDGSSRGILGTDYGLTYIQRFFDLVYEGAKTDDNYQAVLDMFQGTIEYRKTGYGEQDTVFAAPFLKVIRSVAKETELFGGKYGTKIVWINDSKNNAELVYAIAADKDLKRITVVFRGSVDLKDWVQNLDLATALHPNPIQEDYEGKKDTVEIRKGFWRFLLEPRVDNGRNKYDEIADKVYEYGRELGEDFQLQVAGHSLGGVLATLFGFYASTDERFNRHHRVQVRTFGSPVPGKVSFAEAFRHQEEAGRLLHSRFVVAKDPVPNMRFMDKGYAHTGHRIELSTERGVAPEVSYADLRELGTLTNWLQKNSITAALKNPDSPQNISAAHSTMTYFKALEKP